MTDFQRQQWQGREKPEQRNRLCNPILQLTLVLRGRCETQRAIGPLLKFSSPALAKRGFLFDAMRLFVDASYFVALSEGERGFPYITDSVGIASMDDVRKLKAACESHLAVFDQAEIDRNNERWEKERRAQYQEERQRPRDETPKPPRMGFVYLMKNKRNGFVKIGFSKKPRHRERTLQAEDPDTEMLFAFEAAFHDEEKLHLKFADKRVRGEWFKLDESDIDGIRSERAA